MATELMAESEIEELKRAVKARAEVLSHAFGEWKLIVGYWRAYCQNRNCHGFAWVKPDNPKEPYGGNAIYAKCRMVKHGFSKT